MRFAYRSISSRCLRCSNRGKVREHLRVGGGSSGSRGLRKSRASNELVELASHPKVVAIGETGLDYYRLEGRSIADMEWQRERFRTHIRAAHATGKPLIIHTRSSSEDTLRIMAEERASVPGGVMHCFTEPWSVASRRWRRIFTFRCPASSRSRARRKCRMSRRRVPLERLLIETDSPYLAPVPYRGKPNEPAYVSYVGRFIAQLREMPERSGGAGDHATTFSGSSRSARPAAR